MNLSDILGNNVYPFPGQASASNGLQGLQGWSNQQALAAMQRPIIDGMLRSCGPASAPEDPNEREIKSKNHRNYKLWLERMHRDPLADVPYR